MASSTGVYISVSAMRFTQPKLWAVSSVPNFGIPLEWPRRGPSAASTLCIYQTGGYDGVGSRHDLVIVPEFRRKLDDTFSRGLLRSLSPHSLWHVLERR